MKHLCHRMICPAQIWEKFRIAVFSGVFGYRTADQMKAVSFSAMIGIDTDTPSTFPFTLCQMCFKIFLIAVIYCRKELIRQLMLVGIDEFAEKPQFINMPFMNDLKSLFISPCSGLHAQYLRHCAVRSPSGRPASASLPVPSHLKSRQARPLYTAGHAAC